MDAGGDFDQVGDNLAGGLSMFMDAEMRAKEGAEVIEGRFTGKGADDVKRTTVTAPIPWELYA